MKKKVSLLLCVLLAAVCFVGCAKEENKAYTDEQNTMIAQSKSMLELCVNLDAITQQYFNMDKDTYLEEINTMSEFELNSHIMNNVGMKVDAEAYISMFDAWDAAIEECGAFESIQGDYIPDDKNPTVSVKAKFEEREATIQISFDENGRMQSMDVSAKLSLGEILTKAGLNTLLGMGTVFAVLIFLALLIDWIKYIPILLDKMSKKKKNTSAEIKPTMIETVATEETDDLELVAVITAAIAAQEGTGTDGFVVRSIKRRPSNNWN